ncbi:hypothetical protein Nepgr_027819 [Nepenthes gracilis]|uniref:Uncharacterized protein n=1 Tax=Nepenthes gracilis TaxID=150966 RepID=A0AAD3TB74_NEPGR|nr:hypothetical protein Nepgr_027819 [Nepenthes gracilis]
MGQSSLNQEMDWKKPWRVLHGCENRILREEVEHMAEEGDILFDLFINNPGPGLKGELSEAWEQTVVAKLLGRSLGYKASCDKIQV